MSKTEEGSKMTAEQAIELVKDIVRENLRYYEDGSLCSTAESLWGTKVCKEILADIEKISR